jgi:YVTN family beta-propeller protein
MSKYSLLLFLTLVLSGCRSDPYGSTGETVGRRNANRGYTPVNQILTPVGQQIELPGMRPQALALSPDGRLLVTAGKTHSLVVIDPTSGDILQHVPLPSENDKEPSPAPVSGQILEPDTKGQLSFTGLLISPDGKRIYLANVDGSIKVFGVENNGKVVGVFTIRLPPANVPGRKADIPSGLAISSDGKRLYVTLSLSNQLVEIDTAKGKVLRVWNVGVAPFDVVLAGNKAYVSNWGGRRPDAQSVTGPMGHGTRVRVDPVRFIANEGSVSVIDLSASTAGTEAQNAKFEILTGLHSCALVLSPNRHWLVVANAGSDTLSVIDTRTEQIVETIWVRQNPADLFGAQPNALAFDHSGNRLFVCNGTQNAVAVIDFAPGKSKLLGLIPVGWFPGAVVHDHSENKLYVANIKGLSPGRPRKSSGKPEFNSHQYHGSISILKVPSQRELV